MPDAPLDVIVIGGGITGCAVARETALRGLRTTLVDKGDLAEGTSSRSTKLLHGGLRYLEHGQLRLVREALREREVTARLAPHLARPLPFLLPTVRGAFPGRIAARAAVVLYDLLAGPHPLGRGRGIARDDAIARLLGEGAEAVTGGVLFADRQTEDARLTIAVGRAAVARGAALRPGHEVVELVESGGRVDGVVCVRREDGQRLTLRARVVVNAAGPWADRIRAMAGLDTPRLRPTRGAHLVLPDLGLKQAVMLTGRRPRHRLFAIPWRDGTLFGTTDFDHGGSPDDVEARSEDMAVLLEEAARQFPSARITVDAVRSTFAGLRPLIGEGGDTLAVSREHRVLDERGLVSIVGGKLTTWRVMGEEVALAVLRRLGRTSERIAASTTTPLPGGEPGPGADDPRLDRLPRDAREHLLDVYGSEASRVAALTEGERDAEAPIIEGRPEIVAQIDFAVREELALRVEDVLFRRLVSGHDPHWVDAAAPRVAARMARLLGWSASREADEIRRTRSINARRAAPCRATEVT